MMRRCRFLLVMGAVLCVGACDSDGPAPLASDAGSRDGSTNDALLDEGGQSAADGQKTDGAGICRLTGDSCVESSECCSGLCTTAPGGVLKVCGSAEMSCAEDGEPCVMSADCCELMCSPLAGGPSRCEAGSLCLQAGESCADGAQCCSNSCEGGTCGSGVGGCFTEATSCTDDMNCCSGTCEAGACTAGGASCHTAGDGCASDSECCSGACDEQTSTCKKLTWCRPAGEPCSFGAECCSQLCNADGYCQALQYCKSAFEVCATDRDCCSFKCVRDEDDFKRCLPIGGCRPSGNVETSQGELNLFGEVCTADWQCCSKRCELAPSGVHRCMKQGDPRCGDGAVCLPLGEICETDCECCTSECERPRPPDELGQAFPKRCLNQGFGSSCLPYGALCGDPGECCDELCLPWPDETFRCGVPPTSTPGSDAGIIISDGGVVIPEAGAPLPACVEYGGSCSQDADCCEAMLCLPHGGELLCLIPIS